MFIASQALLEGNAGLNRFLKSNFLKYYSCLYYSLMIKSSKVDHISLAHCVLVSSTTFLNLFSL